MTTEGTDPGAGAGDAAANTTAAEMNATLGNVETPAEVTTEATTTETTQKEVPAAPEPYYRKIFNEDGSFAKGWQENLPTDLEEFKNLAANYKDFGGLFKSLKDSMTTARAKGNVKPLSENPTPEELADFRTKMGIPPEPYTFEKPEKLPEGVEWREDRAKNFGEWAHAKNLSPAAAKEAMDLYMNFIAEDVTAARSAQEEQMRAHLANEQETLKLMFGGNLDKTVLAAKRAAVWGNLPSEAFDPGSPTFLGPQLLAYTAKVADMLGEGRLPTTAAVSNMDELSQARDIQTNESNPDHKGWITGNPAVVQKVFALTKQGLERRAPGAR